MWVPNIPESEGGHNLPGYRYALQQRVEFSNSKESKRIWNVIGEGSKEWAEANAKHYGIEVPEEEYILEDHQDPEDEDDETDEVPEAKLV